MKTLPEYAQEHAAISRRAYGMTRAPHTPVHELQSKTRTVIDDPSSLYGWVDVIIAGFEGAIRGGATPYAVAQALMNRQAEMGSRKYPPALPHVMGDA